MNKIKDIFTIESGFFIQLYQDNITLYRQLFDMMDASDLELDFLALCGERYADSICTSIPNMDTLTRVICNRYSDAWMKVKRALLADYDITKPYQLTNETTLERQGERNNEHENNLINSVYGYDSASAVEDKTTTTQDSNAEINNENVSTISTRSGNIGNMKFSDLVQAEIETRKITFLTLVMNDLKEFLTLKIY